MLAGPDVTLSTMAKAIARSLRALDAAAELDVDCSDEDRAFLRTRHTHLESLLAPVVSAERALEDYDLGPGMRLQVRVDLGDKVLDRGLESANARTKLELKGKPGLDAAHVFGQRVSDLTHEKIALEPTLVLQAVERFSDVPDFPSRASLCNDLSGRAARQQACLNERVSGNAERNALSSRADRLLHEASSALFALQGALNERFPRQKDYVASFFLDTTSHKASKAAATGAATEEAASGNAAAAKTSPAKGPSTGGTDGSPLY